MLGSVDEATILRLIEQVRSGLVEPDEVVARLRHLPFTDLGFAKVDHHRTLRQGLAEAVYGPGKTSQQCAAIVEELLGTPGKAPVLLTRVNDAQAAESLARNPGGQRHGNTVVWRQVTEDRFEKVIVATAGTADLTVADECAITLRAHGIESMRLNDVGVAGIHRLLGSTDDLSAAAAVVVVAGMEGALASLIGGITAAPVIAVPTSVGYGTSFGGITALLAMLSSCAAGVAVVGIDNGFGAAHAVLRLLNTHKRL
jgi:hypothetical protein